MSELILAPPSKDTLAVDARSWSEKARALTITDDTSCVNASFLLRSIKGVRADIQRFFAPHIDAAKETKRKADEARAALVSEMDRMEAPLVLAENTIKSNLLAFETKREQERAAQERRLQEEARKHAESVTLAVAADLEMQASQTGDAEMLDEARAILEQPIETPVVHVKTSMPKVQGISYRDNWKAHPDINVKALAGAVASGQAPVNFLLPNMTAINQWARATQGGQTIAGVKVWNDRQIAAKG